MWTWAKISSTILTLAERKFSISRLRGPDIGRGPGFHQNESVSHVRSCQPVSKLDKCVFVYSLHAEQSSHGQRRSSETGSTSLLEQTKITSLRLNDFSVRTFWIGSESFNWCAFNRLWFLILIICVHETSYYQPPRDLKYVLRVRDVHWGDDATLTGGSNSVTPNASPKISRAEIGTTFRVFARTLTANGTQNLPINYFILSFIHCSLLPNPLCQQRMHASFLIYLFPSTVLLITINLVLIECIVLKFNICEFIKHL